jgi:peptidoglycan/xylan/chitin deacetylase (PgdA/CDA1 family)
MVIKIKRLIPFGLMFVFLSCSKDTPTVNTPEIEKKFIALTFDDGPDSINTERIIKILDKYNAKATFFMLGCQIKKYPNVVIKVNKSGHCVANHTSSHLANPDLTNEKYFENITRTENLIDSLCGKSNKLFRPPWGTMSIEQQKYLENNDFKIILWDIDSFDHDIVNQNIEGIINVVCSKAFNKCIVLFHDCDYTGNESRENTILALPTIIETLYKEGYCFVRVDELNEIQ